MNHKCVIFDIFSTPYNYTGEVTAVSSNPEVVSIVDNHKIKDDGYGKEKPIARVCLNSLTPGTSTITLKANGAETSFNVVVKETIYKTYNYMYLDIPLDTPIHFDDNWDDGDVIRVKSSNKSIIDSEDAYVSEVYDYSDNIFVCTLEVETGEESGPVTLTVLYKGKKVGSVTINVEQSDDDDEWY